PNSEPRYGHEGHRPTMSPSGTNLYPLTAALPAKLAHEADLADVKVSAVEKWRLCQGRWGWDAGCSSVHQPHRDLERGGRGRWPEANHRGILIAVRVGRPATPGRKAMQYLVEAARGPLPASPEQAIALLEGTVIPHFEYMIRLRAEGKILAGGIPVGDRAFVCIIEAGSNEGADRIFPDMPAWGLLEWRVTPPQSVEARAEMEREAVHALKAVKMGTP